MGNTSVKVTKTKLGKINELELAIEASKEISSKAYSIACRNIANETDIPGFRRGKAPKDIIEKTFGKAFISQKAFENVFYDVLQDVAKQENLDIVDIVEIKSFELDPDKPLTFKTIVELRPEVKVAKYQGIKVKAKKMVYEKSAFVNKTLEKIANNLITLRAVNGRSVKEGDIVTLDFEGKFEDGTEVPGGKAENFQTILEKDKFLPDFVDKLVGSKVGESKEIIVTFPENSDKGFAGKKGIFKVNLKSIQEKVIPEINDELARKIGLKDLNTLKQKIEAEMVQLQEQNNKNEFENKLVEEIIKNSKFEISERMIEKETDFLLSDLRENILRSGQNWDIFKADEKNKGLIQKAKDAAWKRIAIDLVLSTIIKKENISVVEEELNKEVALRLAQADEKYKHLDKDLKFRGTVRLSMLRNKALDFLVQHNEVVWEDDVNVIGPDKIDN